MIRDLPPKSSTDWYDHYTDVDGAARNVISDVAATITSAATLAGDKHTPVNAAGGAITVTLPTPARIGQQVRVEKVDSSANAVTVSGTLRGAAGTVVMPWQYEVRTFVAESLTSWRIAGGNTPKAALDAAYGQKSATDANTAAIAALPATYGPAVGSDAWLKLHAASPEKMFFGSISTGPGGATTAATVIWPDGSSGSFTGTASTASPGSIDTYVVTWAGPSGTRTVTQPAVGRDAVTGVMTSRPALVVS